MANEAKHITELPEANSLPSDSVFMVEVNASGNSVTSKISSENLFANSELDLVVNSIAVNIQSTPSNSTPTVTKGSIFSDGTYIYIAVDTDQLMRVALESF